MAADVVKTANKVGMTTSTMFIVPPVRGTMATESSTERKETNCTSVASRRLRSMMNEKNTLTKADRIMGER